MSIVIEKAMPPDAKALLDYLKQVGGETENLTFGAEGLPVDQEAEARYLAQMKSSKDDVMLLAKEKRENHRDSQPESPAAPYEPPGRFQHFCFKRILEPKHWQPVAGTNSGVCQRTSFYHSGSAGKK